MFKNCQHIRVSSKRTISNLRLTIGQLEVSPCLLSKKIIAGKCTASDSNAQIRGSTLVIGKLIARIFLTGAKCVEKLKMKK